MITTLSLLLALQQFPVFEAPEVRFFDLQYIACVDLDQDGDLDLLGTSESTGQIRSLLNDGTGQLVPGPTTLLPFGTPLGAVLAQIGDLSGDGIEDLVLKRASSPQAFTQFLEVHLGLGNGAFQPGLAVPTSSFRKNFTLAQLDSDAELELVVSSTTGFEVFEYQAGALVLTRSQALSGVGFGSLQAFDADGNGIDSLFGSIDQVAALIDLPASGPATATPLVPEFQTATYSEYHRVGTTGDIDHDGDLDIVIVDSTFPNVNVHVWANDGSGGFAAHSLSALPYDSKVIPNGAGQASVLMGDWDQDGTEDLLGVRKAGWGSVESPILMRISGPTAGVFDQIEYLRSPAARPVVALADLGGDGVPELVGYDSILEGNTAFTPAQTQLPGPVAESSSKARGPLLDLDGDLDLDYLSWGYQSASSIAGVNDGAGNWSPGSWGIVGAQANETYFVTGLTQDFDGDGLEELLIQRTGAAVALPGLWRCEILPGVGFQPVGLVATGVVPEVFSHLGDFDGDGVLDLITGDRVRQGLPDGTFFGATLYQAPGAEFVAAGDLDGDGDLDLLGLLAGELYTIRQGPGAPTYQKLDIGSELGSLPQLIDLDLDGDLDLAVKCLPTPATFPIPLRCFENQGGSFIQKPDVPSFVSLNGVRDLRASDLDGDRRLDLAALEQAQVTVWLGTGVPFSFQAPRVYAVWPATALADLDQDGDLDTLSDRPIRGSRFAGAAAGKIQQYGAPVAGSGGATPLLGASGPLRSNSTTAAIHGTGGLGGAGAVLVFGTARGTAPGVPLPGLDLLVAGNLFLYPLTLDGPSGVAGAGGFTLPVLNPQNFVGKTFTHQLFVIDPASPTVLTQSNGLELHYGL